MIEIKKGISNSCTFSLKAESGQILFRSIVFSNEDMAKETLKNLNRLGSRKNVFERKTNHDGDFLFSLKNSNGIVIGNSQLYKSEAGMENGISNLIKRIDALVNSDQL